MRVRGLLTSACETCLQIANPHTPSPTPALRRHHHPPPTKVQHEVAADEDAHAHVREGNCSEGAEGQYMQHPGLEHLKALGGGHHQQGATHKDQWQGLDNIPKGKRRCVWGGGMAIKHFHT